jgi:hypothetical protein
VVARSRGRAKYNAIRKLRAQVRRLAIVRRLRRVGDLHQRGLQRQLAEELGVVRSVICEDFKRIRAAVLSRDTEEQLQGTGAYQRPRQAKERTMRQRCTVRLPDALHEHLQREADARQCGVSDVIREGLERLLAPEPDAGPDSARVPEPVLPPTLVPHDCVDAVLARLPGEVRENIVARARVLELPAARVLTALLVAQVLPRRPVPQGSGAARPPHAGLTWPEFKRRWQQGSKVAPPAASPPATAE